MVLYNTLSLRVPGSFATSGVFDKDERLVDLTYIYNEQRMGDSEGLLLDSASVAVIHLEVAFTELVEA